MSGNWCRKFHQKGNRFPYPIVRWDTVRRGGESSELASTEVIAPTGSRKRPTDRTTLMLVSALWVLALAAEIGRVFLLFTGSPFSLAAADATFHPVELAGPAFSLLTASLGALIVLRSASWRFGWLMLGLGTSRAVVALAANYSVHALIAAPEADLPLAQPAAWVQDLWTIPIMLLFSLPFLFPDGRLPDSRWRAVFWPLVGAWGIFTFFFAFARRPLANAFLAFDSSVPNPYGFLPWSPDLANAAFAVLLTAATGFGIASLIHRWRLASPEARHQIKWVVYALLILLVVQAAGVFFGPIMTEWIGLELGLEKVIDVALILSIFGVPLALSAAVLKYRLYEIDLLISRTLAYGVLSAIIIGAYVSTVAGLGALLPLEGNLLLLLVTTVVIAILFNPLRIWLQRGANRLIFGERDDPYRVLSRLGQQLKSSATPEAMLYSIAEVVARALCLPYAAIQLEQNGKLATVTEYGSPSAGGLAIDLEHQNEVVGKLIVGPRSPTETFSARDQRLLEDIAHQAGAAANAVRLTEALRRSRRNMVSAREEERRRLRRDLHDGLGPTLASHTLKLDTALELIHDDPDAAAGHLQELYKQTQEIVAEIRALVHELRPPALDDLGLVGAVQAQVQHNRRGNKHLDVSIEASPSELPPLPAAVELAAYRITLEAVTNVLRHSMATQCEVCFSLEGDVPQPALQVRIYDDGVGVPERFRPGVGMRSMRERAEELGGHVEWASQEGGGTIVAAEIPLEERNPI